jgi:hypothetical protein
MEQTETTILPVDPYPAAVRLFAALGFIVGIVGGYVITAAYIGSGFCSPIGVIVGVVTGGIATIATERIARQLIPSKRFMHISDDKIAFVFNGKENRSIDPQSHVNATLWYFIIKRRSRVPKGWYMIAYALEQDDIFIPAFTLMSPETFEEFQYKDAFMQLKGSRKDYRDSEDLRLAGKQRQLLIVETARSIDGVEMFNPEFEQSLTTLKARFPGWMPKL